MSEWLVTVGVVIVVAIGFGVVLGLMEQKRINRQRKIKEASERVFDVHGSMLARLAAIEKLEREEGEGR